MSTSLIPNLARIRVSSVLNNDVRQYGKKFLVDGNEETCWNSDQVTHGSGQWIALEFQEPVILEELHLTFQGGFVGKTCKLQSMFDEAQSNSYSTILDFFPKDDNFRQEIVCDANVVSGFLLAYRLRKKTISCYTSRSKFPFVQARFQKVR